MEDLGCTVVCLKALFVSCAFVVRVAEAPADHESMNGEDFRGYSRRNKPVFIEEIDKYGPSI